jgi:acyl-coenzyme A thioesterase PaaI-like protein
MTQSEAAPPPQALDSSDEPTITPPLTIGRSRQALASTPGLSQGRIHRLYDKVEAFVSKLSMRDNFWNGICSLIWLPLAFFSGIRMKELDPSTFAARAVLPFRRFNRNWYRAMAGGALLANSEIAGGSYVFGICGADYTVVCKQLSYTFLRPCFGPAVFRIQAREDIKSLMATGEEFNISLDMEIQQQGKPGEKDRRVGKCEATFHVTPKIHHKEKKARREAND